MATGNSGVNAIGNLIWSSFSGVNTTGVLRQIQAGTNIRPAYIQAGTECCTDQTVWNFVDVGVTSYTNNTPSIRNGVAITLASGEVQLWDIMALTDGGVAIGGTTGLTYATNADTPMQKVTSFTQLFTDCAGCTSYNAVVIPYMYSTWGTTPGNITGGIWTTPANVSISYGSVTVTTSTLRTCTINGVNKDNIDLTAFSLYYANAIDQNAPKPYIFAYTAGTSWVVKAYIIPNMGVAIGTTARATDTWS